MPEDNNFRVRFQVQNDTSAVSNLDVQLQYQVNSTAGAWTNVSASSSVVRSSASANLADQANLTQQLGAGTGTFIGSTAFDEVNGICGGTSLDVVANGYFECEFCCQLRSADVSLSDTIYLRTINSDTTLAWTTYTVIAQMTVEDPAKTVTLDDPWENLDDSVSGGRRRIGWQDAVVFNKASLGVTPITVTPSADSLNNWTDNLRHSKNFNITGDSMTMADQPPTVARFGFIAVTLPADSLNNWADPPPTIDRRGILTAALPADSLNTWIDAPPTIVQTGSLTATPPADPLANYADSISGLGRAYNLTGDALSFQDQAPTVVRMGYLSAAPSADSLNLWNDPAPTVEVEVSTLTASLPADSLNQWADDRSVDKQVVGSNPIDVNVPPDNLNNWVDSPSSFKFGFIQASPPGDSLNNWADQPPTIYQTGSLAITPPGDGLNQWADSYQHGKAYSLSAEALNNWADSPAAYQTGDLSVSTPVDNLNNWLDDRTVDKQNVGTTAINVTPSADSLNNWADAATSERRRAGWYDVITFNLQSLAGVISVSRTDALANYADSLASRSDLLVGRVVYLVDGDGNFIVDENGNKIAADGLIDSFPFADSVARTLNIVGTVAINVTPPADGLANYADALRHSKDFSFTDDLNNWADAYRHGKGYSVPAESLNQWADAPTVSTQAVTLTAALTDSLNLWGDAIVAGFGGQKFALATDARPDLVDTIATSGQAFYRIALTDDLGQYADGVPAAFETLAVKPPADAKDPLLDSREAIKYFAILRTLTDANVAYADSATALANGLISLGPDSLLNYADNVITFANLRISLTDGLANYVDTVSGQGVGNLVVSLVEANQAYGDALNVRLLGYQQVVAEGTDQLANWADAAAYNRGLLAIGITGKITDQVSLTGKVIAEQVSLNGKAVDQADITGELYIGDSG